MSIPSLPVQRPIGRQRLLASAWLLVSAVLLLYTLLRPEPAVNERSALASLVPLYFLSFPSGQVGIAALSQLKVSLYVDAGVVLGLLPEALLLWAVLTALGYAQWFVLLPWVARQSRRAADFLSKRFLAR